MSGETMNEWFFFSPKIWIKMFVTLERGRKEKEKREKSISRSKKPLKCSQSELSPSWRHQSSITENFNSVV
jgi:hypothetical protein